MCPDLISIDGVAQTVPAGSTVNLTIVVDATETSLTGNYTCSLFVAVPQQKLWSTSNKYVTSMMDFSLENGCIDSRQVTDLGQPFLVYSESVWRVNPNPFAAQQVGYIITIHIRIDTHVIYRIRSQLHLSNGLQRPKIRII